ncbi:START-like domain, Major latex protein domain protein [Artemisia annua]|uniref:START-like domain, Major latex protein domain protein n=1 Tax=Artemisia annua TaxID=35608 RepID=A0A2U1MSU0_ARTAN|nr:START-like domain, Major latex protein domain protein [Artemisia annua]
MALVGKIAGQVEIRSGGKALHDLLRHIPNDIPGMCPDKVHGCDLVSGERGVVGSTICWHYTHEKKKASTQIVESVDETNHTIRLKVIGGELIEIYKAFTLIYHCESKDGKDWGTWTFEFERADTSVPYPTSLMDYLCDVLKDMDAGASAK